MSITWDSSDGELAENTTRSTVKVDKVTYEWTIENFDFCEAKGSDLISPEFSSYKNRGAKWNLKLTPNGKTDAKDNISLHLYLSKNSEHRTIFAKYSASILNSEQEKQLSHSSSEVRKFSAGGNGWGWNEFCKKEKNFREKMLSNNVLKISYQVIFSQKSDDFVKHDHNCDALSLESSAGKCDVTEDLGTLLKTHLMSDVVISVKSKEYPAHKTILAARSKVFAAMFQHDTKENQLNRIGIEDMSEEVVGEMLCFIYTGNCEKLEELAEELLVAADKYDLNRLKMMCAEVLLKNLSVENAANVLILAYMHNVNALKSKTINFIGGRFDQVMNTEGWKNVSANPQLMNEVCLAFLHR